MMMMEKQIRAEHQQEAAGRRQQQQEEVEVAVVVHSRVRRIKQEEDERAKVHETYQHQQHVAEMMRPLVLRDLDRQQRSRSPLGRAARTAISIGGDS